MIGVNESLSQGGVFAATGKNPDYSPVTDELVFSNYTGVSNSNDIFVMNLTPGFITSPYFVASAPSASDFEPTWANDGNTLLFRALTTPPGGNPAMLNAIYTVARPSGAWGGITNLTQQNSSYGPIKPDYAPSGTQVIAWYDTGIFMGNVPTPGQYLWFAANPIANTNYNTNNADWHIYDPTPPPTGSGTGLTGTYHLGTNLSSPVGIRLDPTINFNFVATPPTAVGIPSTSIHNFSVRWTGVIYAPYTGNYIFHSRSDDGFRLIVDGLYRIDHWFPQSAPPRNSDPVPLVAGQPYSIQVDYFSSQPGGAGIYLGWSLAGEFGEQVIPQQYLYPSATHTATPTFTPTRTPTPTATPTPTVTPTPTATATPATYPIGMGLLTPSITSPGAYGTCADSTPQSRPGCAIEAYLAILQLQGFGGTMTWQQFIALTINGEASVLYAAPGVQPLDLQCIYNLQADSGCGQLRLLFEQAIMRQIYEACGGTTCSEQNFVKFLAGPPFDEWGIQAWYQAGNPVGEPNLAPLISGAIFGIDYTAYIDNAENQLNNTTLQAGCNGLACSWGNPGLKPPPPNFYSSSIQPGAAYGVFDGRVYFIVGR
ncbi:MAG: PA14 domain-containing protein [Chloroflexota bacterium]|nr:PA14 domain-containing protein [Chloroflexota bacterium]